jgi:tetratricopeptide (TPR) repeat protein
MRGVRRWTISLLLLIVVISGLLWLSEVLSHKGLDWASKFSEVASFVLAVTALLVPVFRGAFRWSRLRPISGKEIEADVESLAAALRGQLDGGKSAWVPATSGAPPMRLRWEIPTEQVSGALGDVGAAFLVAQRRLVVLGASGSGKSTLVWELARRLLESEHSEGHVPVILPVGKWDPGKGLSDWIGDQLARDHPALAARGINEAGAAITHAQALVAHTKVLPILDGLDEMPEALRTGAITEINRYGVDRPLVLTSRPLAYDSAARSNMGRPVERTSELKICHLNVVDIKDFLAPSHSNKWNAVFERLDSEPRGPLAQALSSPLMLWLAGTVYSDRSPDELADRYRFGSVDAVEGHLLGRFVHAVYAERPQKSAFGSFQCNERQAQRWLGFLAGDFDLHYPPKQYETRHGRKIEVSPPPDLAWWRLGTLARGWRLLGVGLRALLLCGVIAAIAGWLLDPLRRWRFGSPGWLEHFSAMLLSGPLGRSIHPAIDQLSPRLPIGIYVIGGLLYITAFPYMGIARYRPARLSFRPFKTLRAMLIGVIALTLLGWVALTAWLIQKPHHLAISAFMGSRSALMTLLAITLLSILWLPSTLIVPTDLRGGISPTESLRLDRQADIVVALLFRAVVVLILGLLAGLRIAVACTIFVAVSMLIATLLGGQFSLASRRYTDACIWLAIRRHLPLRAIEFMADAESRGILRAVGAHYEFRHIRVQQQLHDWWERRHWTRYQQQWVELRDWVWQRLGRTGKSLPGLSQTVEEYRTLVQANPGALETLEAPLAGSLRDLASKLAELGRLDDELDVISERTEIYRKLAGRNPDRFGLPFAGCLHALASRLEELGRKEESLGTTLEALDVERELAKTDASLLPGLGESLSELASKLKDLERRADERDVLKEAAECYRRVAAADAAYRPRLAESLTQLAFALDALTSPEFGTVIAEVLELYRQLAEEKRQYNEVSRQLLAADPATYLWPFQTQSAQKRDLQDGAASKEETVAAVRRAVASYRDLAKTQSGAFLYDLRRSLDRLAELLTDYRKWDRQELEEGWAAFDESHEIWRTFLVPWGNAYLWGESGTFHLVEDLTRPLWKMGRRHEALAAIEVARLLNSASWRLTHAQKMVTLARKNVTRHPTPVAGKERNWQQEDAEALDSLGEALDDIAFELLLNGLSAEATRTANEAADSRREAVIIYRELSKKHPAGFLPELGKSLERLAIQLHKTGDEQDEEEARNAASEACTIRHALPM